VKVTVTAFEHLEYSGIMIACLKAVPLVTNRKLVVVSRTILRGSNRRRRVVPPTTTAFRSQPFAPPYTGSPLRRRLGEPPPPARKGVAWEPPWVNPFARLPPDHSRHGHCYRPAVPAGVIADLRYSNLGWLLRLKRHRSRRQKFVPAVVAPPSTCCRSVVRGDARLPARLHTCNHCKGRSDHSPSPLPLLPRLPRASSP
jgi:hypothetical protein